MGGEFEGGGRRVVRDGKVADDGKRFYSDGRFMLMRSSNGEGVWGRGGARLLGGEGWRIYFHRLFSVFFRVSF